jgi:hypothetical protein
MTEHKTKDQAEKGDVTLHGGKPVSMAQAEVEAKVGGPIDTKAVHKAKDKAEKPAQGKGEEGSATWANHPIPRNFFDAGLGAVTIYPTLKEAHKAAAEEAKEAGITPAAVMHVSPEGGSTGVDD